MSTERYLGEIVSVPIGEHYGFVGIETVTRSGGRPHGLHTTADVFVHQDECNQPLRVGLTVSFMVAPDSHRSDRAYRAVGAVEVLEGELVPVGAEPVPGFPVMAPLPDAARAYLAKMKPVPQELVTQVVENQPLAEIPRGPEGIPQDTEGKQRLLEAFLRYCYPTLVDLGADFRISDPDDASFDQMLQQAIEDHLALGLTSQIPLMEREVASFRSIRQALGLIWEEGLVRRDTIIPIRYLPDLFLAAPVWYFWTDQETNRAAEERWNSDDPQPHPATVYFCDLFPSNRRWADTFQMYNRRLRTLEQYTGDVIPPHVTRRMRRAVQLFDYVVLATPYHDVAGKDWQDLEWLRSIDPYVLGFKQGLPVFFVLARFSDSGVFPLYHELVADTIQFLRENVQKLNGFNRVENPYWYLGSHQLHGGCESRLGSYLINHTKTLLKAFEAGRLFDWLRGEADVRI